MKILWNKTGFYKWNRKGKRGVRYFEEKDAVAFGGKYVWGIYDPKTRVIMISKEAPKISTILHEIGHWLQDLLLGNAHYFYD